MPLHKLGSVALAVAIAGGALALPTAAVAAPSSPAASQTAAAPYITVSTPETYLPYTKVTITGTATPNTDVYLRSVGLALPLERLRSDAEGRWSYTPDRALSGNFGGNTVTVVAPDGRSAQTTFALYGEYPEPTNPTAAFRPVAVTSTAPESASSSQVRGTATPGAVIVVRGVGYAQSVTAADANGNWSTTLAKATPGDSRWFEFAAYQTHTKGADKTLFTLGN